MKEFGLQKFNDAIAGKLSVATYILSVSVYLVSRAIFMSSALQSRFCAGILLYTPCRPRPPCYTHVAACAGSI